MRALLNTLYITTQGAYLKKDGETVLVSVEHETRLRVPIHTLSGIVCFGNVTCSPPLMGFCAERQVGLSFLSEHGRFLARVEGEIKLEVAGRATVRSVLDALEARYPALCGTLRDQVTQQRRPFVRFFACEEDLSHDSPDTPLPDPVVSGAEPFLVVGAIAGG